ncbi:hypothetical protein [Mycobacterium sp. ITM-2016-00318]|uniref:hypothetical protein n=1 Tax=Mycobacterium sp. ITM-2016-00318 TaxID=2099693 RepID=UPI000CFA6EB9|nr:hypothetical protein [Mycobacterium sp. ITM-2016-00318]WNG95000.1 hypothetical protein C6A82_011510 [Mycobacterium sp. ITM-2016-00318]
MSALLVTEYDRRKTLEARGGTVLTSCAAVLALIFGLTVLVTGKDPVFEDQLAVLVLFGALLFFVLSASIAIVVQTHLHKYDVVSCEYLKTLAESDEEWLQTADHAVRTEVSQKVRTLCSLRGGNNTKAKLVVAGLVVQMIAIALLAASLGLELYGRL